MTDIIETRAGTATATGSIADPATDASERLLPLVTQLEQALEAETAALVAGDPAALLDAIEHKRQALMQVEAAARHLPAEAAEGIGEELEQALERCRRANEAAGGAITALKRRNEATLELLGFSVQPEVYGPTGAGGGVRATAAGAAAAQAAMPGATGPSWTA